MRTIETLEDNVLLRNSPSYCFYLNIYKEKSQIISVQLDEFLQNEHSPDQEQNSISKSEISQILPSSQYPALPRM